MTGAEVRAAADTAVVGVTPPGRRSHRAAWAIAAALLLVGVAVTSIVAARRSPDPIVRTGFTTTVPAGPGTGRLVVTNVATNDQNVYIEGGIGFTRVTRDAKVVAEVRGWGVADRTILDRPLAAGRYVIESWEVACPSSCPRFDENGVVADPSALADYFERNSSSARICRTEVTVRAGRTTVVELARDPFTDDPVKACGLHAGQPIQLVLVAPELASGAEGIIHRYVLTGPDDVVAEGPIIDDSTFLVLDHPVPPGTYEFRWEAFDCPGSCPTVGPDGRPINQVIPLGDYVCRTKVPITDRSTILQIDVGSTPCPLSQPRKLPPLTIPPRWNLRRPLPVTCGNDLLHATALSIGNGVDPSKGPRQCFLAAHRAHQPMELISSERRTDGSSSTRVWRTEGSGFQIYTPADPTNGDRWTIQNCGLTEAPAPEWIRTTGCGTPQVLPLTPD